MRHQYALRRFLLYNDSGTSFIGANHVLKQAYEFLSQQESSYAINDSFLILE